VWDKHGKVSGWSEPAFWSMGIMNPDEWKAKWIGAPWEGEEPIPDRERPLTVSRANPGQTISDIYSLKAPSPLRCFEKHFQLKRSYFSKSLCDRTWIFRNST